MLKFQDFFVILNKLLYYGAIDLDPQEPITKREKIRARLKTFYIRFIIINLILINASFLKFIFENYTNVKVIGSVFSNLMLGLIVAIKTAHFILFREDIKDVIERLESVFKVSYEPYKDRYMEALKWNNICQKVFIVLIFGTEMSFFSMPIIQNIIHLVNGGNHWERILYHQIYIPFDYEPMPV